MIRPKAFILKGVPVRYHHGALGVCRTLGRLGVRVAANDEGGRPPAAYSRYRSESVVWDPWPANTDDILERLVAWGRRQDERAVLLPVDDAATILVDDHAAELAPYFRFPVRPDGLARRLSGKWTMAELATAHGVPTARVARVGSEDDLGPLLDDFRLPVVIKRIAGWEPDLRGNASVTVARTRAEVAAVGRNGWENFLLQEFIPGRSTTSWMFNGYFDAQSRCRFALTGYKLRQFPVNGGFTTLGRLERHEGLLAVATRFFSEIGYVGIIDVGFRFDARDSSYKLLDVNPRVGSTFRLFVDTDDHDVVSVCYDDLTGQSVPATAAGATARTWQVEPHDWRAGLELIRQGRTSLRGFLKSFTLVDEMAWWARDDPKPLAAAALSGLAPVFRRSPSARDAGLASG